MSVKKTVILEFVGPRGSGKTTLVNKLTNNKNCRPLYDGSFRARVINWCRLPFFTYFLLKNNGLVRAIYKSTSRKKYFIHNLLKLSYDLYLSVLLLKKINRGEEARDVYYCEHNLHNLFDCHIKYCLDKPELIIKELNNIFYSKHVVFIIYVDINKKEIVKRRKERKKIGDLKSSSVLCEETEKYNLLMSKLVKLVNYKILINTKGNHLLLQKEIQLKKQYLGIQ